MKVYKIQIDDSQGPLAPAGRRRRPSTTITPFLFYHPYGDWTGEVEPWSASGVQRTQTGFAAIPLRRSPKRPNDREPCSHRAGRTDKPTQRPQPQLTPPSYQGCVSRSESAAFFLAFFDFVISFLDIFCLCRRRIAFLIACLFWLIL